MGTHPIRGPREIPPAGPSGGAGEGAPAVRRPGPCTSRPPPRRLPGPVALRSRPPTATPRPDLVPGEVAGDGRRERSDRSPAGRRALGAGASTAPGARPPRAAPAAGPRRGGSRADPGTGRAAALAIRSAGDWEHRRLGAQATGSTVDWEHGCFRTRASQVALPDEAARPRPCGSPPNPWPPSRGGRRSLTETRGCAHPTVDAPRPGETAGFRPSEGPTPSHFARSASLQGLPSGRFATGSSFTLRPP
jgi:hypothetical protein